MGRSPGTRTGSLAACFASCAVGNRSWRSNVLSSPEGVAPHLASSLRRRPNPEVFAPLDREVHSVAIRGATADPSNVSSPAFRRCPVEGKVDSALRRRTDGDGRPSSRQAMHRLAWCLVQPTPSRRPLRRCHPASHERGMQRSMPPLRERPLECAHTLSRNKTPHGGEEEPQSTLGGGTACGHRRGGRAECCPQGS